jgi:hypothetical protein
MRDLVLLGCLIATAVCTGYAIQSMRSWVWGAGYFLIGVVLAWVVLTDSSRFGPW